MLKVFFTLVCLAFLMSADSNHAAEPSDYFGIQIVDSETGRGVPLVELQCTSGARYYTDSGGWVAFYEPGLMNKEIWFEIASPGYEFAKDGFGLTGAKLMAKPGRHSVLKIKRINIAERLYRITGQGIYRDSVLLGERPPIQRPLINGDVTGQDSVMTIPFEGKLYWMFGDTTRLSYGLGNFAMSGATTELPSKLDPLKGFDLDYFVGRDGFSRPMAPMKGEGVVWLSGLVVLPDDTGKEQMLTYFERRKGLGAVLESGFMQWDRTDQTFHKIKDTPLQPLLYPALHYTPLTVQGVSYLYFEWPYPCVRTKAEWKSYLDLANYEAFTCLKNGSHYEGPGKTELDRDAQGKLNWEWKRGTGLLNPHQQEELIKAGKMQATETPFRLTDARSGKLVLLNNSTCYWNEYRKKYVMIACQGLGDTGLGEIWYSEADQLTGPWLKGVKIITHANKKNDAHDFYNPAHHPFFDQQGGRIIFLEGSYVNTFSGNPHPTPYYEYNQIMYKLDLSDPRLHLD